MSTTVIHSAASPITVANGGTGAATLTGLLLGNGTSAVSAIGSTTVAAGPWTPAITFASMGTFAFGTFASNGRYTILGNVCFFTAQCTWASTSGSGQSGNIQLSLPTTSGSFAWAGQGVISGTGLNTSASTPAYFTVQIGSGASIATVTIQGALSASTNATLTSSNATFTNGSESLTYSGWYFVS